MPPLSALRAFDATAAAGSFAAAAQALNVTPAAVAQQVRALEAELGLGLTEKAGRGIRLTDAGVRLAQALAEGFGRIAAGVEAARELDQSRGVRVSATPGMASKVLLPGLGRFWQRHPDIAVTIAPDRRSVDLVAEGFDLAIRAAELHTSWPGTESRVLIDCEMVVVGAPALFAEGPPDPLTTPWFTRSEFELGLLRRAGFDIDRLKFRDIGSPTLESAAARMGYGLMVCPEIMVRDDLRAGELRVVPLPPLGTLAYYAVWPSGRLRQNARDYIDWLARDLKA